MDIKRRYWLMGAAAATSGLSLSLSLSAAQGGTKTAAPKTDTLPLPVTSVPLWPSPPAGRTDPGLKEVVEQTSDDPKASSRRLKGISQPRMDVFPAKNPNGGAVLIIPGGGFGWNYYEKEGYRVTRFLTAAGYSCFVLFYRLANDGWDAPADVGLADAQRAMRLIRQDHAAYKIDPERIGVMGFSAGGFIAASLATRHAAKTYAPVDAADALSARPALAAPLYPVQSLTPGVAYEGLAPSLFGGRSDEETARAYVPARHVDATTPPMFLAHSEDDGLVPVGNTLELRDALAAKHIQVETHLFAKGGHGWGPEPDPALPCHLWPQMFLAFARSVGLSG